VRWHTPGLAAEAAAEPDSYRGIRWRDQLTGADADRHRVERAGGLLIFAAKPPVLRDWAVAVYQLGEPSYSPMDYTYFGRSGWWPDGEVQIFDDYRQGVSAARVARREVLAELPHPVPPADLQPLIWQRAAEVRLRAR
jgi:hypothetical protein